MFFYKILSCYSAFSFTLSLIIKYTPVTLEFVYFAFCSSKFGHKQALPFTKLLIVMNNGLGLDNSSKVNKKSGMPFYFDWHINFPRLRRQRNSAVYKLSRCVKDNSLKEKVFFGFRQIITSFELNF